MSLRLWYVGVGGALYNAAGSQYTGLHSGTDARKPVGWSEVSTGAG